MSGSVSAAQRLTIANERTKLMAQALDRASTGCFVVGLLGPVAATGTFTGPSLFAWFAAGIVLHIGAQATLGRLR